MSTDDNIIPLFEGAARDAAAFGEAPYESARALLDRILVDHTLHASHRAFVRNEVTPPLVAAQHVMPWSAARSREHKLQNAVFVLLIDGAMPRPLNKHFRLRASNKVTWRNLQRMVPELDMSDFKAAHCRLDAGEFASLLWRLLPSDYALLVECDPQAGVPILTHMHVKVERLTDRAISELSKSLGYIERSLFERGEDYVEALESKFFEYYGFAPNASGRKSAAAMAAQLFASHGLRFAVYVASQSDGRLTILDDSNIVIQHMLISLEGRDWRRFKKCARKVGVESANYDLVESTSSGGHISHYHLRLERTAATGPGLRSGRDKQLVDPWLAVASETIAPAKGDGAAVPFAWARGLAED